MFTGIIETIGKICAVREEGGAREFSIRSNFKNIKAGESIAVEGVCLTVLKKNAGTFTVSAGEETLKKTTLASIKNGAEVNLERAMKLSDRLGGHIVQGHADGKGQILSIAPQAGSKLYHFSYPGHLEPFIIQKGSIAVCGVSLTVAGVTENSFSVSILTFTEKQTSFKNIKVGDAVNLEADLVAKIIAQQTRIYRDVLKDPSGLYQKVELNWQEIIKKGNE